jgi:hypothetical protein
MTTSAEVPAQMESKIVQAGLEVNAMKPNR